MLCMAARSKCSDCSGIQAKSHLGHAGLCLDVARPVIAVAMCCAAIVERFRKLTIGVFCSDGDVRWHGVANAPRQRT